MTYYYGRGTKQNDVTAFNWFQRAAEEKNPLGMWMVGKFYKEGRGGLEQDLQKSQEWYGKAKALGADYSFLENKSESNKPIQPTPKNGAADG